ncbi:MAG: hypothetical protein KKB20_30100 [Proteobacteria bacterium]|nr:hypothetical protein [Pseudomonadota bacterium]
MPLPQVQKDILEKLSKEELLEFIDMYFKNWWNLQNNWMAYMDSEYGQEAAVKADGHCFSAAARVQMYRLRKMFNLGGDADSIIKAMVLSTIWANGDFVVSKIDDKTFRFKVTDCWQQVRRLQEGMGELACKAAGQAICDAALEVMNPDCKVRCLVCPPDEHPKDVWCEWEFTLPD